MEMESIQSNAPPNLRPSAPQELLNDIDLASITWADCMPTGTDDDIFDASVIFSSGLPSLGDLSFHSSTSSLSSSTMSTSSSTSPPPSPGLTGSAHSLPSELEMGEIGSNEHASCASETPLTNLDGGARCASNNPSPKMEEGVWMKPEQVDHVPKDVDLFVTTYEEMLEQNESYLSSTFRQDLNCEDQAMCRLDDMLQLHPHALGDLGTPCLENSFSSLLGQDFTAQAVGNWSLEFPSESSPPCPSQEMPETAAHPSENAAHVFAQWQRNNAGFFSRSDLKKIKLKISTVETATRRLGGGEKGMMHFLKLILIWIQSNHLKRRHYLTSGSMKLFTGPAKFDERPNDCLCTPSSVECGSMNGANLILPGLLEDELKEELGFSDPMRKEREGFGSMLVGGEVQGTDLANPVAVQQMNERYSGLDRRGALHSNGLSQSTTSSRHDAHISSHSISAGKNRWTPTDGSGETSSFNVRNSPGSASQASRNTSLHGDEVAFPSSFPLTTRTVNGDNGFHVSMAQLTPPKASLKEKNLQPFSATGLSAETGTYMAIGDSLNLKPSTPADTTRAARKSRMARQRWNIQRNRKWPSSAADNLSLSPQVSGVTSRSMPYSPHACHGLARSNGEVLQGRKSERNLRLLLQKELKQSDVGNLGRIVLPKKEAERNLPYLELRDGVNLVVEDLSSSKVWTMRYRFWPNNKSRMYLLENTGDFVKAYNLKEGDYMMMYCNPLTTKYMIQGVKVARSDTSRGVIEKDYADPSRSHAESLKAAELRV